MKERKRIRKGLVFGTFLALIIIVLAVAPVNVSAESEDIIEEWVARFSGSGNGYLARARAIATDSFGNVYVTGYGSSSGTYPDYATVAYDSSGNELWVASYNGPGNGGDEAYDIAVDSSGNVYVTGQSWGGGTRQDYATVAYDSSGNELWVARYNSPSGIHDSARDIAVDSSGNVYVTGQSYDIGGRVYATIKYDSSGNELWVASYRGPGHQWHISRAIAIDSNLGNIYVTGQSHSGGTSGYEYDYATVAYDSSGNELWVARYSGPATYDDDKAWAMAVDSNLGNVYVTGYSQGIESRSDYVTVAYDSSGNELWVARYNGPGNYDDSANAIAVDSSGNVYVTGYSYGIEFDLDYATVAYDSTGNQLWVARYDGLGTGDYDTDRSYAIAIDLLESVYVTGDSGGSDQRPDFTTIKYSKGPEIVLENLITLTESFNLQQGISNSLDMKLQNVLDSLTDAKVGNDASAINRLNAFINSCEAQRDVHLTNEQVDTLIQYAQQIIAMLQQ